MTKVEEGPRAGLPPRGDGRRRWGFRRKGSRHGEADSSERKLTDYYGALGISIHASQDEVKKAYRDLASSLHPDRNPGNKDAEERLKSASEAYKVLGNEDTRRLYDGILARRAKREALAASLAREVASDHTFHQEEVEDAQRVLEEMYRIAAEHDKEQAIKVLTAKAQGRLASARAAASAVTDPSRRQAAEAQAEYTYTTKWCFQKAETESGLPDRDKIKAAKDLEKEAKARASDGPKAYRADGKFLRISYGTHIREVDGSEEYVTTAEWVSPRRDEQGNYSTLEGIMIRREQMTGNVWVQRITGSYHHQTFAPVTQDFVYKSDAITIGEIDKMRESLPPVVTNPPK